MNFRAGGSLYVLPCHKLATCPRYNPAIAPMPLGYLSAHLCIVAHTLCSCLSSLRLRRERLLATFSSLSLNTHSHNTYTNTPARMAHLTPEISEPWEAPDGGCRLGACSLTILVQPRIWKKRQGRVAYWILLWILQIHSTVDSRRLRFAAEM